MKLIKIFIIFTFLLFFAVQVSARDKTPKIVWKNLQKKYESFYDIKPRVQNQGGISIFYHPYPWISLFYWDEKSMLWRDTNRFLCYVGRGFSPYKLKPQHEFSIDLNKEEWDTMTIDDYMSPKFKSFPDYNGKGKYKLKLSFGLKKSELSLESFSPEFEVIEKDFNK